MNDIVQILYYEEGKLDNDENELQVVNEVHDKFIEDIPQVDARALFRDIEKDRWTVKLHVDSALFYYVDTIQEITQWENPFDDNNNLINDLNISEGDGNETKIEEEHLAGFDDTPNQEVFKSENILQTISTMSTWIERTKLSNQDNFATRLNYPEYISCNRDLSNLPKVVQINLRLPKSVSEGPQASSLASITMVQSLTDSVGTLLEGLFKKFSSRENRSIDEEGTSCYIFKLVGFNEYLIHHEFKLSSYDCVFNAAKDKQKLDLSLVKLLPTELMDLDVVMRKTEKDFVISEMSKHRPDGDEWTVDEANLAPRTPTDLKNGVLIGDHIAKLSVTWPLRVMISGISNCPHEIPCDNLHIEVNLYFNGESLLSPANSLTRNSSGSVPSKSLPDNSECTPFVPFSSNPRFPNCWIDTKLDISSLPSTTRIAFTLVGTNKSTPNVPMVKTPIAGVSITLVDFKRHLVTGEVILNMYPHENLQRAKDPLHFKEEGIPDILNLACNLPGPNSVCEAGALHLVFDSYSVPVLAEIESINEIGDHYGTSVYTYQPSPREISELTRLDKVDALYILSPEDKVLLWICRNWCTNHWRLLPKFLQAVNWCSTSNVAEAYRLLSIWKKSSPLEALGLLDIRYSDPVVREYAIRIVDSLPDNSLQEYLLQLVQVLKYEAYHDSPLARFLLRRALLSPLVIGHSFFWMLKSEMHSRGVNERYGVILYLYIHYCGAHKVSLQKQSYVNGKIKVIADHIKTISGKERRLEAAKSELELLDAILPAKFCVCLTPRVECRGIKFRKCKVMESKKMPLWIVLENADPLGKDFYTIFKSGDDLRQDQLTLQLLRIMDTIWRGADPWLASYAGVEKEKELDLRLKPYKCCSTGHDLGMIEVVVDSNTTANIQTEFGGKLTGAFSSIPIDAYLQENNPQGNYPIAVDNFVRTCAGYCVATYVLGIGDRHADNIMVSKSGHLFHIDFGHFLGNFKSKYGFNRERAPFVFTPEMAYVMRDTKIQGSTYGDFERMCCDAYNMLRRRADLFINLFTLMVPAAMPELLEKTDISYLREMLSLQLTVEQADAKFIVEIKHSLSTVSRRIDNWFHNLKHKT